ncbi:hypothetical protein [Ruminococcus sp.]|uniref:hypothetical protein n=1 Tax=Ruminococcus sp. TaxID=41978 RepID=UPI0025D6C5AF|nr:hypothetical protein [Ruminococcus sp.]
MGEIGSEFYYSETKHVKANSALCWGNCFNFVFSGRTAIETVLRNEKNVRKAMLPSYCCDSMIEPFRQAGIEVCFYPVYFDKNITFKIDIPNDVDCLLWCNYFGFKLSMPYLDEFKERGGIVIEDITHSFLSMKQFHKTSDYLVASLRKWEPVLCGGYFAVRKSIALDFELEQPPETFLNKKMKAMKMKGQYLSGDSDIDKSTFLNAFSESNEWLAKHYSCLAIDEYSRKILLNVDYQKQRKIRISNARILYKGLEFNQDVSFLFPIDSMDCPLFIPVVIAPGKRNAIRKKLIDNQIYCPVHWPHPSASCQSNLYEMELSLICDQRYSEDDMQRIVDVLNN